MRICWSWLLFIAVVAALALAPLLAGCGQKGPLHLPDDAPEERGEQD